MRVPVSFAEVKYLLSRERLFVVGDKDIMLQGDKTVIRVTKRRVYNGFGINVWVRCKKRSSVFALSLGRSGIRVGSEIS